MIQTKKILVLSISLLVFLGVILFFIWSQKETESQTTLAQQQKVISSSTPETSKKEVYISPEKQKQLNEIKEIYTTQEIAHRATVTNIIRKYNSNFSGNDEVLLLGLVEEMSSAQELSNMGKEKIGINLLKMDSQKMLDSYKKLTQEKNLELTRLESFNEKNLQDLNSNSQKLIELSVRGSIKKNTSLSSQEITKISRQITLEIFNDEPQLFNLVTFEDQETLIQNSLNLILDPLASLSKGDKKELIIQILQDISNLEVLQTPEASVKDNTSFLPLNLIFDNFQKLAFLLIPETHASEVSDLSPEELEILILKTEILIERILQESIETEIRYNKGEISDVEYESIIQENLIDLEELVILKESLENDPNSLSLDDIQRFDLGAYVDDSAEIENLPVLSYIQQKSGHIVIYNLNGSSKLGEENMSLYSKYSIETLPNSTVTLVFSDESILKLDPLSKVTISTPSDSNINVAVEKGSIWSRVLKPLFSGDIFTIDADGVSLGVRGTSVSIIKGSSGTTINIVDSYTPDGSSSVTLTQDSGVPTTIASGKEITIDSAKNVSVQDVSRAQLLSREPQIADFLRDDLTYISLLLDDRKRGFYNTPFISKNDGDNFIQKIAGELEITLPQVADRSYIIKNTELSSQLVSTGSIYHLIKKDRLITTIKNNPAGNTNAKIAAVVNLDMQTLEVELGNKREIETRFDYNILQDITNSTTFTTQQLKEIFTGFPVDQAKENARLLAQAKKELSINNGSSIVTGNISPALPTSLEGVDIDWESLHPEIITDDGIAPPQDEETSTILTATLTIGNLTTTKDFALTVVPRVPTPEEQLRAAEAILSEYIEGFAPFGDKIIYDNMNIPDFSENGGIIPDIRWSGSEYINEDGTTNRPSYTESPFSEYKDTTVSATLTHPLFPDVSIPPKQYSIAIQREDVTDEELLVQAVQIFQSYFIDFGRRDITNTLSYPTLPVGVQVTWENVASYISASGDVTRPSFNQGNEEITLKAKFTHPDAASPKYVANIKLNILKQTCNGTSQTIIGTGTNQTCYDLVAAAEYDNESYKLGTLNPSNQENKPGFVTIDGKTGINPLSSDGSYLSYNLSSLDLSDDWAIEMSVRGEDLNRNDYFYNLLDIRDNNDNQHNFQITRISGDRKFSYRYNDTPASYFNRSSNYNSGYKDILIQGNKLSTDRDSVVINIPLEIKNIYLGTKSDQSAQWNGLINYLKLYKKN